MDRICHALFVAFAAAIGAVVVATVAAAEDPDEGVPAQQDEDQAQTAEYYPTEELSAGDLSGRSLRELSLMRNTIYARAGHEFSTEWLADYFGAQDWYEGGGLDEEELSELDRDNVDVIREYEQGMTERTLRQRRLDHWDDYDLPDDGQWSAPGPFDDEEDAIEAQLIDEALDELLDEKDAFRFPSDPGDDSEYRPQPDPEVPDSLGGVRLGEQLDDSQREQLDDEVPIELLDLEGEIAVVVDDDGDVEQIVYLTGISTRSAEQTHERDGRLRRLTLLATPISEQLGAPRVEDETALGHEQLRWQGDERTLEIQRVPYTEADAYRRQVTLRTNAPERICGPEDGFDQWYEEFAEAMEDNYDDPEAVVEYFDFPFTDGGPPPGIGELEHSREIEDRETFENMQTLRWMQLVEDDPVCVNERSGYGVWTHGSAAGGALRFKRIEGEWKAVGLMPTPWGHPH